MQKSCLHQNIHWGFNHGKINCCGCHYLILLKTSYSTSMGFIYPTTFVVTCWSKNPFSKRFSNCLVCFLKNLWLVMHHKDDSKENNKMFVYNIGRMMELVASISRIVFPNLCREQFYLTNKNGNIFTMLLEPQFWYKNGDVIPIGSIGRIWKPFR